MTTPFPAVQRVLVNDYLCLDDEVLCRMIAVGANHHGIILCYNVAWVCCWRCTTVWQSTTLRVDHTTQQGYFPGPYTDSHRLMAAVGFHSLVVTWPGHNSVYAIKLQYITSVKQVLHNPCFTIRTVSYYKDSFPSLFFEENLQDPSSLLGV